MPCAGLSCACSCDCAAFRVSCDCAAFRDRATGRLRRWSCGPRFHFSCSSHRPRPSISPIPLYKCDLELVQTLHVASAARMGKAGCAAYSVISNPVHHQNPQRLRASLDVRGQSYKSLQVSSLDSYLERGSRRTTKHLQHVDTLHQDQGPGSGQVPSSRVRRRDRSATVVVVKG